MTRYRNNNLSKTLKDYTIPFVWLFLILILLYNFFSWWNPSDNNTLDTSVVSEKLWEVQVSLWNSNSKAYIIYESWKKVEIEDTIFLQKSEKISVESWNINIDFPLFAKMKLREKGELIYKADWTIFLESGNLWVEAMKNIDLFMKFSEISIPSGNIINLSQNELESIVYSIYWDTLVSNLAWNSVKLQNLEKIIIKSKEASSTNNNLDSDKKEIDDYFKLSAWFKENNWDKLLKNINNEELTGSLLDSNKENLKDLSKLINFDNITDEEYVKTNIIDLVWRYSTINVWKITINNIEAKLDLELWTFLIKWFSLNSKVNDLVIKIFDKDFNLISKEILTIYTKNSWSILNTSWIKTNNTLENFPVRATDFIIYEPSKTWKISTKSNQVTIRWKVTNTKIKSVLVNNYKLKSFNWSTWRYHAFVEQWTLKDWTNNYEIKYLDKNWKLIYKEYYSIYKELKKVVNTEKKKISDESKIN